MNQATTQNGGPQNPSPPAAQISAVTFNRKGPWWWWLMALFAVLLAVTYLVTVGALFGFGIGILGNNIPVGWGFPIINVAWLIDLGHGSLLIAAGLMLMRQHWQTATRRIAENIALFAGAVGGSMAVLHTGRPQYVYFLFIYPNNLDLWPQWRSPLTWDFFGIIAFLVFVLVYWYFNMLPDLAVLRDRAKSRAGQWFYGVFALGWQGTARQWTHYQAGATLLAVLAIPMAISTIGISALDFAGAIETGYHSSIMPIDAIVAALASALAMILFFAVLLRSAFDLHHFIGDQHLNLLAQLLLASVLLMAMGYLYEVLMTWFNPSLFERQNLQEQLTGIFAPFYWPTIALTVLLPQLLWWRGVRTQPWLLVMIATLINVGIWLDHYTTIVTSEAHGFMPSAWRMTVPTLWDWLLLAGSVGLFLTLMFGFMRFLPVLPIFALRKAGH